MISGYFITQLDFCIKSQFNSQLSRNIFLQISIFSQMYGRALLQRTSFHSPFSLTSIHSSFLPELFGSFSFQFVYSKSLPLPVHIKPSRFLLPPTHTPQLLSKNRNMQLQFTWTYSPFSLSFERYKINTSRRRKRTKIRQCQITLCFLYFVFFFSYSGQVM